MEFITREEFAVILGVNTAMTYQTKGFPPPCKKVRRNGWPVPMWGLDVAEAFNKSIKELDLNKVKSLNGNGVPRKKMANILNTTVKRLSAFCRKNNIVSLATIKDIKARTTYRIRIQNELLPRPPIDHPFNRYLFRHVQATPLLRFVL